MIPIQERWKPIIVDGLPTNYEVSDLGRIRRSAQARRGPNRVGHIKSQVVFGGRYKYVKMCVLNGDGRMRRKHYRVHRLVANAFLGPPPTSTHQVDHKDTDITNNVATNLQWLDQSTNIKRSFKLTDRLSRHVLPQPPITDAQRREMWRLFGQGMSRNKIAKRMGLHLSTACRHIKRMQAEAELDKLTKECRESA